MTQNNRLTATVREDDLDAAAGRGLSSFVSFLKSAARDTEVNRTDRRPEIDAN
ncbi:MAG: hypothetical protein AAFV19_23905 [Pseudomonadota bacterium]